MAETWLAVAVCTNRKPEDVRPTLEALAGQAEGGGEGEGARMLLVTSGLAAAGHERHVRAAAELGFECLREPRPGLSVARNRALAALEGERVIAYLDDDAIPAPDWLERLAARWRQAGPEVACIGGAILPRWLAPPPAWVSERIYKVLSLLDLGPELIEMEPGTSDVWGANIGFRVEPLRAAGGFDPALGAYAGIPLFGEESAVQRRLAAMGRRVLYAGDVRVEHLIGPERLSLRGIARRRFFFGVVASTEGRRTPLAGLARAARAAGGLAVAAALRRMPLVGERTARLAENLGVAAAPLVRLWLARRHGWPAREGAEVAP